MRRFSYRFILALLFGSGSGIHIEFKTETFNPTENLKLKCDGWCQISCKRINKDQSIGQDTQYTLLSAYDEKFFGDVTIKSCDNITVSLIGWREDNYFKCPKLGNEE
jgi:hypothetical protein